MKRSIFSGNIAGNVLTKRRPLFRRLFFASLLIGLIALNIWFASRFDVEAVVAEIEQALKENPDYRVTVGDVGWGWLAGFGISLQDLVVESVASGDVLMRIDSVHTEVALVPFLAGAAQITLNQVEIEGVRAKLRVLEDGTYAWEKGATEGVVGVVAPKSLFEALVPVPRNTSAGVTKTPRVIFNPSNATISDVVIDFVGPERHDVLRFDEIVLQDLQAEQKEAQAHLIGEFKALNQPAVRFDVQGRAFFPLRGFSAGRLSVEDTDIKRQILDIDRGSAKRYVEERPDVVTFFTPLQIPWRLDVEQGELRWGDHPRYATKLQMRWFEDALVFTGELTGDVRITLTDFVVNKPFGTTSWAGNLHIHAVDVGLLEDVFGMAPPPALQSFSVEGDFRAVLNGLYSDHAAVILNGESFIGELIVVFDEQVKIRLHAEGRQLSLDPWLRKPRNTSDPSTGGDPNAAPSVMARTHTLLFSGDDAAFWSEAQHQSLSNYRWELFLRLERMTYAGLTFYDANFSNQFDGLHINAEVDAKQVLGGHLNMRVALDLEPETPVWQMQLNTERTEITALSQWLRLRLGVSGIANLNGYATLTGFSQNELLASLSGAIGIRSESGWLDMAAIKAQAMRLASVTAEEALVADWPNQFRFSHLEAALHIGEGIENQRLEARVDGLAVQATGYVDPFREWMQLDVGFSFAEDLFTSQWLARSGYFRHVEWPVTCRGRYSGTLPCRLLGDANNQLAAKLLQAKMRRLVSPPLGEPNAVRFGDYLKVE